MHLNAIEILKSDNMFISHQVDITSHVKPSSPNLLQIDFDSALVKGREIVEQHPEHAYNARQGGIERIGVRKAQYHWGWDWGPKYMTCGPWKPVRLETYSSRIEDLRIEYKLNVKRASCEGVISARVDGRGRQQVRFALRDGDNEVTFSTDATAAADGSVETSFSLQNLELWYPHGYGNQPLYRLSCELIVDDNAIHTVIKRIGFRTAELIQEHDNFGKSFYFRVNGIGVFAGGSCWIPADNFIPRLTPTKYRDWMELMVESNQIMIRYVLFSFTVFLVSSSYF